MNLMPILAAAAEHAADEGNPFQQVARQFGWEPRLFISQLVLFVIVAIVLAKFAYKPLLAMLDKRREQIEESLKNAEKTRAELAQAQAKAQEIIGQASAASNKIIEEARAAAAKVTETETQKAVAAAQEIINKARQANEAELAKMKSDLRKEIGTLAVKAAMQVTGKVLTADDQKRLANETNQQLAA